MMMKLRKRCQKSHQKPSTRNWVSAQYPMCYLIPELTSILPNNWMCNKKKICLGLADDDSDAEQNDNNVEMVEKEVPLPVCNKPFSVKKFRDALRRGDCITGK